MVNIRRLIKSDILPIVRLEEMYLGETFGEEMLEAELDSNIAKFYTILEDDKVIGYIGCYVYIGDIEVLNFVIDEEYQRKGYGQMLFDYMVNETGHVRSITLEVRRSNEKGKNFYFKNGFREVGVRKEYYKNKEDALVLLKEYIWEY